VRVDLVLQTGPSPPLERGAPRLDSVGPELRPTVRRCCQHLLIWSQAGNPGASEITKDQPIGGGSSRKLNNIIGVRVPCQGAGVRRWCG
jgi:hypothetical protein